MKKQVLWLGMVLLTLAALPLLGGGASPGKARPFKASSVAYVTADNGPSYDVVMYGQATHLGKFKGQFLGVQYFPEGPEGPSNVGSGTLTAANGDSVTIDMVDYPYDSDGSIGVAHGTYVITGGTGRFLNASGHGSYVAVIDFTYITPPVFTFDGSIVY
jgi:hypothetical protein